MPLNPHKHDLDDCVLVRIHAEITVKGCYVGMWHGWAASIPGGSQLDRVFLVGDEVDASLHESIGPELDETDRSDPVAWVIAQALWAEARKPATTVALIEAREALEGKSEDSSTARADHTRAFFHEASL